MLDAPLLIRVTTPQWKEPNYSIANIAGYSFMLTMFFLAAVSPSIIAFTRAKERKLTVLTLNIGATSACILLNFVLGNLPISSSIVRFVELLSFYLIPVFWSAGFFVAASRPKQS